MDKMLAKNITVNNEKRRTDLSVYRFFNAIALLAKRWWFVVLPLSVTLNFKIFKLLRRCVACPSVEWG
jgi:hypothetical protein